VAWELSPTPQPADEAERLVQLAEEHREREEPDQAIELHEQAIVLRPEYIGAYAETRLAHQRTGARDEAAESHAQAITANPDSSWAYSVRAAFYANLEQIKDAVADYTKAIELDPRDPCNHYFRGLGLKDLGRIQEAIGDVRQALGLCEDPEDPRHEMATNTLAELTKALTPTLTPICPRR
jgi:tetratricopeptide (TPR) repeat protein